MALIEVNGVTKVYESEGVVTAALRGVSCKIESGEFVAIMGPSGSGKSTMLHVLGFLERHTEGTYKFDGKEYDDYSAVEIAHVRNKKMGFIFQTFNLLPRQTVLENVKLPLLYSDIPEKEWDSLARKAVERVGLAHRVDFSAVRLSGGEKQRVAIARALVNNPNVIFADEPTGNLDSKSGGVIMETLRELNEKEGHTIILVTHETYTSEYARRMIRLKDGLIEIDAPIKNRVRDGEEFRK